MFSNNLVNLRKHHSYTLEELSKQMHISRNRLYDLESGVTNPTEEELGCLEKIFDISKEDLLKTVIDINNRPFTESQKKNVLKKYRLKMLFLIIAIGLFTSTFPIIVILTETLEMDSILALIITVINVLLSVGCLIVNIAIGHQIKPLINCLEKNFRIDERQEFIKKYYGSQIVLILLAIIVIILVTMSGLFEKLLLVCLGILVLILGVCYNLYYLFQKKTYHINRELLKNIDNNYEPMKKKNFLKYVSFVFYIVSIAMFILYYFKGVTYRNIGYITLIVGAIINLINQQKNDWSN